MPGFDGRGPRGQGAFSGGGRGYCVSYLVEGDANTISGRGSVGYGRGLGKGCGRGRGFGRRRVDANISERYGEGITSQTEAKALQEKANMTQEEINILKQEKELINKRIAELKENVNNTKEE
ncbi:MAG: DUF5320 domain-containing protein [PVC group bacterium]|nr:DUF5320 domain-containing protein [PVC group bacterium]